MASTPGRRPKAPVRSELASAVAACRSALVSVGLFSGMSNILMLTGSFFMLEIYDRVLPSRSIPTLVVLCVLAGGLYAALGILDLIRGRILVRVGNSLDEALSERVYDAIVRIPLKAGNRGDPLQPLRDLDAVRAFLSGAGPIAFFDMPWIPIYLAICFAFHFYIGLTALVGMIILVVLTLLTEMFMRHPSKVASESARTRNSLAEASRRNAEALTAMGMTGRAMKRWSEINREYVANNEQASDVAGGFGAFSKVLRMVLQSLLLAVGAWLVINQQATAGVIIAGSIVGARALAPIDLVISQWKVFVAARQGWARLNTLLAALPKRTKPMQLQPPTKNFTVETVAAVPPGEQKIVLSDVAFALEAGNGLGIIGPTASGKSSLVRLLVGIWQPVRGKVRIDGAALDQWAPEEIGKHIGYLPQDVELFAGTVADNIARFEDEADPALVIAAAKAAGVHELIVSLPEGYDSQVGENGSGLSAGQAQRIALARALYRDPFLVVLDEPNANLDADGDEALTVAIRGVRERGGIVIVVAHRPSAIVAVDLILVMNKGRMHHFGPKDEVLAKAAPPPAQRAVVPAPARPLQVVPDTGRAV
jgi:PrtD family type I secretion system ABC transporter